MYHAKKYCAGALIQQHTSFEDAKVDCNGNKDCTCISDTGCQNNEWNIYKDATIESSHATCSWTKIGNGTPFLVPLAQKHFDNFGISTEILNLLLCYIDLCGSKCGDHAECRFNHLGNTTCVCPIADDDNDPYNRCSEYSCEMSSINSKLFVFIQYY